LADFLSGVGEECFAYRERLEDALYLTGPDMQTGADRPPGRQKYLDVVVTDLVNSSAFLLMSDSKKSSFLGSWSEPEVKLFSDLGFSGDEAFPRRWMLLLPVGRVTSLSRCLKTDCREVMVSVIHLTVRIAV
jgi:hypothetical protein